MELTIEHCKFNDGYFVRLLKGKRWICFQDKVWLSFAENFKALSEAMEKKNNYTVNLTTDFHAKTDSFRDRHYVTLVKKDSIFNLNEDQWMEFLVKAKKVTKDLTRAQKTNYLRVARFAYYCDGQESYPKWFFTESSLINYGEKPGESYKIVSSTTPAPTKEDLCEKVAAYLTQKYVSELIKEDCYGCQYDRPSQHDHTCLEEDIEKDYLPRVNLKNLREAFNKTVERLGLPKEVYSFPETEVQPVLKTLTDDYTGLFKDIL